MLEDEFWPLPPPSSQTFSSVPHKPLPSADSAAVAAASASSSTSTCGDTALADAAASRREDGDARHKEAAGQSGSSGSKYWHRLDKRRVQQARQASDAWQRKIIDKYLDDYPLSPPEEHAWSSDPDIKVLRKFQGAGLTPAKYLDCQYNCFLDERDVERWRLLGKDVRIIDHAESEAARDHRKLTGQDIVQTLQGINMTEDQAYCRAEWPPPDPYLQGLYDSMPDVEQIAKDLVAKGKGTDQDLVREVGARMPKQWLCLLHQARQTHASMEDKWDPAWVRHQFFPPANASATDSLKDPHFAAPNRYGSKHPALKWLHKWREIDEKEGHLWFKVYEDLIKETDGGGGSELS
jgi:hypothetical protein